MTIFSFPSKLLLDSRETAGVCGFFPFGINISPKLIGIVLDEYQILLNRYFCLFAFWLNFSKYLYVSGVFLLAIFDTIFSLLNIKIVIRIDFFCSVGVSHYK